MTRALVCEGRCQRLEKRERVIIGTEKLQLRKREGQAKEEFGNVRPRIKGSLKRSPDRRQEETRPEFTRAEGLQLPIGSLALSSSCWGQQVSTRFFGGTSPCIYHHEDVGQ